MTKSGEKYTVRQDDAVEALLEKAAPRPVPPAEDEQRVREAVHAEWRSATGKLRTRRQFARLAIAASVLLAVALSFNAFRETGVEPVTVAAIDKSHGSIYRLGERSELTEVSDLATITTGQTISTGTDSGIGLAWHGGGSLRIDAATTVEFIAIDSVFLHDGRIYFDAQASAAAFAIETAQATVSHLGTQYMTAVDGPGLTVSVREGEVNIDRGRGRDTAYAGQKVELVGDAAASVTNISRSGAQWNWVEATAPTLDFSDKSTFEFLHWVSRETGLDVVFESAEAERVAREGRLVGTIPGLDPRRELEVRMLGEDLDYVIDRGRGTISVSAIEPGT